MNRMADFDGITLARTAFGGRDSLGVLESAARIEPLGQRMQPDLWANVGFPELAATVRRLYSACGWSEGPESRTARTVAVAGGHDGDGSSSISWALAIATAHDFTGDVVLVECDLLHPSFRGDLGLRDGPGLGDLLAAPEQGAASLETALCPTRLMNLWLLPAGQRSPNPSRLLRSGRMADVFAELRRRFAFVILDLPSVLRNSEAAAVGRLADGVVVVLRAGSTDERSAKQTLHLLSGASVRGVVLNRWRPATPSAVRRLVAS
jgi:Mrp family chromosome partitioning ATPase